MHIARGLERVLVSIAVLNAGCGGSQPTRTVPPVVAPAANEAASLDSDPGKRATVRKRTEQNGDVVQDKMLRKGAIYVMEVDGDMKLPAGLRVAAASGDFSLPSLYHAGTKKDHPGEQCNGALRQGMTDDGKIVTRCAACGYEWPALKTAQ